MANILFCVLASMLLLCGINAAAQNTHEERMKLIEARSKEWNRAYNSRDSLGFYSLFDSTAIVVSLGGKWIGLEKCKNLCRSLYQKRPDILWKNEPTTIEVNDQWPAGYETGTWSESWTETGDTSRSEIKGKYWIMWFFKNDNCYILSAIFTPLSCTGSYCNK